MNIWDFIITNSKEIISEDKFDDAADRIASGVKERLKISETNDEVIEKNGKSLILEWKASIVLRKNTG